MKYRYSRFAVVQLDVSFSGDSTPSVAFNAIVVVAVVVVETTRLCSESFVAAENGTLDESVVKVDKEAASVVVVKGSASASTMLEDFHTALDSVVVEGEVVLVLELVSVLVE